jgi:hypothetical protein
VVHLNEVNTTGLGVLVQFHLFTKDWAAEQALKDQIFVAVLKLVRALNIRLPTGPLDPRLSIQGEVPAQPSETVSAQLAVAEARGITVGWTRKG